MALLNSYVWKVGLGKSLGLAYGLVWFFTVPLVAPEADPLLRWGVLGWTITMGAIIVMAVMAKPRLGSPFSSIPTWLLSALLGAWMGVLIMLFAHDLVAQYTTYFWPASLFMPWSLVVETALVGVIIGWASSHAFQNVD